MPSIIKVLILFVARIRVVSAAIIDEIQDKYKYTTSPADLLTTPSKS